MSTTASNQGVRLAPEPQGGVRLPPSAEKIESKFDLSIALALSTWSSLTLAVQNSWGGPESSEKRDWFAGAVSDLFQSTPDADVDYVEEFLLQVMNDEFDVNVEDGSGEEIAARLVGLRKMTLQGDFTMVDEMYARWNERQRKGGDAVRFQHVTRGEEDDDTDWDSGDMDTDEEQDGDDTPMDEAPALPKAPKEKVVPKVDDEGFTEVVGKKRR
ncbi:pre-rRNA-processing protein TSR2 [Physcia stellaris]|nr:pre-rRNA-processing protein TSR2 [Physcia stellaris]